MVLLAASALAAPAQVLVATNAVWAYRKGTSEASAPVDAWRRADFDDAGWARGAAPFYYDTDNVYTGNTVLPDMRSGYTSLYLRRTLPVSGLAAMGTLRLRFFCDDGFALWINGTAVTNFNKSGANFAFNALSTGSPAEPLEWVEYTLPNPQTWLQEGDNQLAVQAFNTSRTSSDFVFTLQLTATARDAAPPRLREVLPPPGIVGALTSVTVVFSEPVSGVGFSDLLVNQRPAMGVAGGGDTYTFAVEQPAYGDVRISWDPGAGITDFGEPPNRFEATAPAAEWSYRLVDVTAPTVAEITPAPGNTVRALTQVEVRFSEAVTGVDAADLRVGNGTAESVAGSGGGPYVFRFAPVATGTVTLDWVTGHGIEDLATPANAFAGGGWTATVDPEFKYQPVRISEILAGYGGDAGLRDEDDELQDWIELHNRGTTEANLRGWALTDDPEDPGKWVFPDARIAPGGYLVVFASGKDRKPATAGGRLHTNFKLGSDGEYLGLYDADAPRGRVAEFAPAYPVQRNDVSYGFDLADRPRHFTTPTPGAPNGTSTITGVLPPVDFNVGRGVFERPFELHLSSAMPGAEIRYTTDGNEPTSTTGTVYVGPIQVVGTSVFRAAAFAAGHLPSASTTHTYVFPGQVARQPALPRGVPDRWIDTQGRTWTADYEMDPEIVDAPAYRDEVVPALKALPVLSIVARPADLFDNANGIYPKSQARGPSWERPASAEIIDWAGGGTVQANCGVQMQGNSVRDPVKTGKHAFRLVFKGDYGPAKLRHRVFPDGPLEEFDTLTIRADFNNSWMHWNGEQRPRGLRMRDAWMKESQRAMGGLASHSRFFHLYVNGLYWGVYDAVERPDAAFAAAYLGGAKEEYDVVNEGAAVDGNMTAYNAMRALTGVETQAGYERMKQYLDVPAYIDYLLLHFYTGHEDWFTDKNWYASRRRVAGAGFRYQAWDGELMLNSPAQNIVTRTDQPSGLHARMLPNPQYRMDFADRVQRHLFQDGALVPSAVSARFDRWAAALDLPMVAESARWGDYRRDVHAYSSGPYVLYTRDGHFRPEWQRLKSQYFPGRTATLLGQLKAAGLYPANAVAPVFNVHGGRVPAGFALALSAPSGSVYVTTDGSDPRVPHAATVAPTALPYRTPLVLETTTVVKARTQLGNEWSALAEARFEVGPAGVTLAITEIHYHPPDGDPYEFVEVRNFGAVPVDATGFSFDGIAYVFPPGAVLEAGRTVVLASGLGSTSFRARHPGVAVFGWFDGSLSDGGERLALRDRAGRTVVSVDYDDAGGWPRAADGAGSSLELLDPRADPDAPAHWRASLERDGTPGTTPTPATGPPEVRLDEILATGDGPSPDWIEIRNAGAAPVDLGGWSLTDDSDPRRYVFPAGTVLASGGRLVVTCRGTVAGTPTGPSETGFALDREGETVSLFDPSGTRVDALTYGAQIDGASVARIGAGDEAWGLASPTPGAANVAREPAPAGTVAINEILANPVSGADDWVELFNRDPARPAAVGGYQVLTTNGTARVSPLTFVPPGGFLVLVADEQPGATHLDLRLPAAGGFVALLDSAGTELDRLDYGPQETGESRGRLPDGGAALAAFAGTSSPGAGNFLAEYRGPVLNELLAGAVEPLPDSPGQLVAGWVELHNPGSETADLAGLTLSPDRIGSDAWTFPSGTRVPAGGFVVIRCDGTLPASTDPGRGFNTGFALGRRGGGLFLFDVRGRLVDGIEFGPQARGLSLGRTATGWRADAHPTPGAANAAAAVLGSPDTVRINEFLATSLVGGDWVELHHPGAAPVPLAGLQLTDDPGLTGAAAWTFPPLSFLDSKGFLRIEADGRPGAGPGHAGFQLAAGGEALLLLDPSGRVIDEVYFGRQQPDVSLGRLPDGAAGAFQAFARPTPGLGNATVAFGPPRIVSAQRLAGELLLRIDAEIGPGYRVDATADFRSWTPWTETVRPSSSPFELRAADADTSEGTARFYRVVLVP